MTQSSRTSRRSGTLAARPPEAEVDYRALSEFRHQIRKFLTFSEAEARAAGIEPQQHQLLLAVKGLPEGQRPTIGVLADRLKLRHHTVVGLVDRLVAARLATRKVSDVDSREILIEVSSNGEKVLRALAIAHRAELEVRGPELARALEAVTRSSQRARNAHSGAGA